MSLKLVYENNIEEFKKQLPDDLAMHYAIINKKKDIINILLNTNYKIDDSIILLSRIYLREYQDIFVNKYIRQLIKINKFDKILELIQKYPNINLDMMFFLCDIYDSTNAILIDKIFIELLKNPKFETWLYLKKNIYQYCYVNAQLKLLEKLIELKFKEKVKIEYKIEFFYNKSEEIDNFLSKIKVI